MSERPAEELIGWREEIRSAISGRRALWRVIGGPRSGALVQRAEVDDLAAWLDGIFGTTWDMCRVPTSTEWMVYRRIACDSDALAVEDGIREALVAAVRQVAGPQKSLQKTVQKTMKGTSDMTETNQDDIVVLQPRSASELIEAVRRSELNPDTHIQLSQELIDMCDLKDWAVWPHGTVPLQPCTVRIIDYMAVVKLLGLNFGRVQ